MNVNVYLNISFVTLHSCSACNVIFPDWQQNTFKIFGTIKPLNNI